METPTTDHGNSNASRRHRLASSKPTENRYRVLLERLQPLGLRDGSMKTIGLTSSNRREGVSTVACNLALHAAIYLDLRVLIVDANFQHPGLHRTFEIKQAPGLSDLLHENAIKSDCIEDLSTRPLKSWPSALRRSIRPATGTGSFGSRNRRSVRLPSLSVLPAGNKTLCATNCLGRSDGEFLETISSDFNLVIVDLPAVSSTVRFGLSVSQLSGILVVLQAEKTRDLVAQRTLRQLKADNANLLGVVFNRSRMHLPRWIDKRLGD